MDKTIVALLLLAAMPAMAEGPRLSANPYAPDSTSNPVGIYGSPNSPLSANNPYGQGIQITPSAAPHFSEPTINVWSVPHAASTYDGAGMDTLGAPGSGLQFKGAAPAPAQEVAIKQALPEPHENIIDALDGIRKEKAAQ